MDNRIPLENAQAQVRPGLFATLSVALLDLLYPPRCTGCDRVDWRFCDRCTADLVAVPLGTTHEVSTPDGVLVASTGRHSGRLQDAVQALKYNGARDVARPLGKRLAGRLATTDWPAPEVVVPVPLGQKRLKQRGYNQAGLLAAALADEIGVPLVPDAIQRARETRSQVGLGRSERLANMSDAFVAQPAMVGGKGVLIVDDVFTTGATLAACAAALRDGGAQAVYGLTVSEAPAPDTIFS